MKSVNGSNRPHLDIVPIARLSPSPDGARIHNKKELDKLTASIQRFGPVNPLIIDQRGMLIDGNARFEVLKSLGFDEIAVMQVGGLTPTERLALRLALNRIPQDAGWENEKLRTIFEALAEAQIDLDLTGFDAVEIDHIVEIDHGGDGIEDGESIPKVSTMAISRKGDIWRCGRHRMGCGDALDLDFVRRVLNGASPDMAFVDMPYNVPIDGFASGNGATQHREFCQAVGEMSEPQFIAFVVLGLTVLKTVLSDRALIFASMDWRHAFELLTAVRQVPLELLNLCVWAKTTAGLGSFYRSQHELVFVLKASEAAIRNNMAFFEKRRNRSNLWTYRGMNSFGDDRDELVKLHPTVKPIALIADAIRDVTKRGDAVIDTFLGSGSTIMAAEETGRAGFGVEIDPLYVDVAVRRWQQATKADAIHEETGEIFDDRALRLAKQPV